MFFVKKGQIQQRRPCISLLIMGFIGSQARFSSKFPKNSPFILEILICLCKAGVGALYIGRGRDGVARVREYIDNVE